MNDSALEAVLRRDRAIVVACLASLTIMAWSYLVWLARAMDVTVGDMAGMVRAWTPGELMLMVIMWVVMMVGMMAPSAAPMILIYARVGRAAALRDKPLAAAGFFAGGYLLAWTAFALVATVSQWALQRGLLLTPTMASASAVFSGVVLIAAGVYQWTPLKRACLRQCQAPLSFIQRHGGFRRTPRGSLVLGFRHGLDCIGCCWALMALLFVGGLMNLVWIALIAILVLAEKAVVSARWLPHIAGTVLGAAGVWLLVGAV